MKLKTRFKIRLKFCTRLSGHHGKNSSQKVELYIFFIEDEGNSVKSTTLLEQKGSKAKYRLSKSCSNRKFRYAIILTYVLSCHLFHVGHGKTEKDTIF